MTTSACSASPRHTAARYTMHSSAQDCVCACGAMHCVRIESKPLASQTLALVRFVIAVVVAVVAAVVVIFPPIFYLFAATPRFTPQEIAFVISNYTPPIFSTTVHRRYSAFISAAACNGLFSRIPCHQSKTERPIDGGYRVDLLLVAIDCARATKQKKLARNGNVHIWSRCRRSFSKHVHGMRTVEHLMDLQSRNDTG